MVAAPNPDRWIKRGVNQNAALCLCTNEGIGGGITMRADEIVIISLAALDVLICWAIYELMTGRLTHLLAG